MNNEIRIITKLSNGLLLKPRSRTIFFSSFFRREYKRERNNGDPVPPVDFSIHDPITSRVSMLPTSSFSTSNESLIVLSYSLPPFDFRSQIEIYRYTYASRRWFFSKLSFVHLPFPPLLVSSIAATLRIPKSLSKSLLNQTQEYRNTIYTWVYFNVFIIRCNRILCNRIEWTLITSLRLSETRNNNYI